MKTSEFIQLLEDHAGLPLYFEYQEGAYVRPDYHITEIKNVIYDTVDCGGVRNEWQETHVQLWENELPEPGHSVDTTKALKIFEVVEKVRPTFQDTDIKFEYGNARFPTSILPVHQVMVDQGKVIISLVPDQTTCKAKDRATTPEEKANACCGPAPAPARLKVVESKDACVPGNGCC